MTSGLQQSRHAPKPVQANGQSSTERVNVDDAENLEKFLSRLNFGVGQLDLRAKSPSGVNPRSAPSNIQVHVAQTEEPGAKSILGESTNEQLSPALVSDTARRQSFKEAVHQAAAGAHGQYSVGGKSCSTISCTQTDYQSGPMNRTADGSSSATAVTPPIQTLASIGILAPPPTPANTASHPKDGNTLPFAALPYTLRSSSLGIAGSGASSSAPIGGLSQSRYAPGTANESAEVRKEDFERRATNALAQQDAINKRIAALKARHEEEKAQVAQREAAKRKAEEDAKHAVEEEVKRRMGEEVQRQAAEEAELRGEEEARRQAEEAAKRAFEKEVRRQVELEAVRREAEHQEAERVEAVRRKEVERKEAARLAQEKADTERREKERLEAEQREAVRKEAERKVAERKEAERKESDRLQAERAEAEREKAERAAALQIEAVRQAEIHEAQVKIDKDEAQQLEQLFAQKAALELQVEVNQQRLSEVDTAKAAVQKQIDEARKQLTELETAHEQAQQKVLEAKARLSVLDKEETNIKEDARTRKEKAGKEVRQLPITEMIPPDTFAYMGKIAARCMKEIDRQNVETEHKLRFKAWPQPDVRAEGKSASANRLLAFN